MANTLKIKRGTAATIPQGQLAEPLFTTDTYDLYIGKGSGGNQRIQNYIASGTSSQFLKGDGTLDSTSYQPLITAGTTLQYYRGDKTFQTLDTSVVPENGPIYFTEPRVRATVLTGLNLSGGGTIAATDSILTAFGKVQNQISALVGGATYQGTWNASTNTPTLASGTGTKGYYYVVSVAGSTNLDGITDWKIGDWAIFNGTTWDKVDNTDAVSSVNGFTGAVNLALDNISDVSAASPTNAQLLRFNGTSSLWENWTPTFEPALTKGNLTEATSSVLTITGGTGAVIGSGTTIAVAQASGSTSGYLSSTDWTTFNNKQAALTNPVTGTGTNNEIAYFNTTGSTISSLSTATYPSLTELSYVKGVTSAIQTQLNAKEPTVTKGNLTETTSSVLTITGGTGAVIGSGTTIAVASAGAAQAGVVTTGTQTFAGAKTFSSNVTSTAFIPTGATIPTVGMYSSASNFLDFSTNSTRAITIDAGQKVGIGADPISAYRLYVNGDILAAATVYGSMGSFVGTGTFGSTVTATAFIVTGSGVPSNGIYLSAANTLALSSGSSQRMILNSSGNIGINTNAPVGRLHVHHSSDTDSRIVVTNSTTGNGSVGAEKGFHVVEQGNNTYLFNYQNGPIIFGTNGTENGGFRLNAGGNVGLGNTNNAYKLEVTGTTKLDGTLLTTGAATFSSSVTVTSDLTVDTNTLYVDSTNNRVGIGTTTFLDTTYKLSIKQGTNRNLAIAEQSSELSIEAYNDAGSANVPLRLYASEFNMLGGSVGIGTTAPNRLLEVATSGDTYLRVTGNRGNADDLHVGNIEFYNSNTTRIIAEVRAITGIGGTQSNSGQLAFYTNNAGTYAERMRITSGGNVLIGVTSDSGSKLRVEGGELRVTTSNAGVAAYYSGGNGEVAAYNWGGNAWIPLVYGGSEHRWNTSGTERMRITSGGYLKASNNNSHSTTGDYHDLRNSASGSDILYMVHSAASPYGIEMRFSGASPNNTGNWFFWGEDSTALRIRLNSDGGLANYQANNQNLSDIRTKKDIISLESYWDKFKALEIVKFKYNDQTHDDYNIGVIAQQVENVAPEFVDVDGWGETPEDGVPLKSIYTADLYHATIKVLQEAMEKIEVLESELAILKNK